MDRKQKRKKVTPIWKPICTQSSSYEEYVVKDVKVEYQNSERDSHVENSGDGNHVKEAHYSISSHASKVEHVNVDSEPMKESNSLDFSSRAFQENVEKHSISIEVGHSLIRFVKGKGGSTQKQIEESMGVKIVFPSSKEADSITIEGISAETVTKASEKVQVILDEAVNSRNLDYSHFISLPLAIHPELVNKLVNFQNSILRIGDPNQNENSDTDSNGDTSDDEQKDKQIDSRAEVAVKLEVEDDREHVKVDITNISLTSYPPKESKSSNLSGMGIDKSIFIKPKTFHLTVLMLKLWNTERVATAADVLKNISSKVIDALDNRPIAVRLKGLDCMRGSLAKARVLYVPVEEIGSENRLLRACQVIVDAYTEAGLVLEKDARQKLKLHATVMNARHRKRKNTKKFFDSFDARGIFKQYGAEDWGEYLIREAHLSQRFVFDENGYYHRCASIPFPESMQVD